MLTYVRPQPARDALATGPSPGTLEAGGERFEGRAVLVAFANGRQYGGGRRDQPRRALDDGLLDVVVSRTARCWSSCWRRAAAVPGRHRARSARYRRLRSHASSSLRADAAAPRTTATASPSRPRTRARGRAARRGRSRARAPARPRDGPATGPFERSATPSARAPRRSAASSSGADLLEQARRAPGSSGARTRAAAQPREVHRRA